MMRYGVAVWYPSGSGFTGMAGPHSVDRRGLALGAFRRPESYVNRGPGGQPARPGGQAARPAVRARAPPPRSATLPARRALLEEGVDPLCCVGAHHVARLDAGRVLVGGRDPHL